MAGWGRGMERGLHILKVEIGRVEATQRSGLTVEYFNDMQTYISLLNWTSFWFPHTTSDQSLASSPDLNFHTNSQLLLGTTREREEIACRGAISAVYPSLRMKCDSVSERLFGGVQAHPHSHTASHRRRSLAPCQLVWLCVESEVRVCATHSEEKRKQCARWEIAWLPQKFCPEAKPTKQTVEESQWLSVSRFTEQNHV